MHQPDLSALIRWPNVPACYGWLSLDRRGRWRLQGEPVTHAGFIDFINRQYGSDEAGHWFLQNGPQRVFVELEYTPWVLHTTASGELHTQTGEPVEAITQVLMDEEGNLLIHFEAGLGVMDDRDLASTLSEICDHQGAPASDHELLAFHSAAPDVPVEPLYWRTLLIQKEKRAEISARFGFQPHPHAGEPTR